MGVRDIVLTDCSFEMADFRKFRRDKPLNQQSERSGEDRGVCQEESMMDDFTVLDAHAAVEEAIAILQCAEDASNEEHVRKTMGIAVSMLLGALGDIPKEDPEEDRTKLEAAAMINAKLIEMISDGVQRAGLTVDDAGIQAEIDPKHLRSFLDGAEDLDAVELLSLHQLLKLGSSLGDLI